MELILQSQSIKNAKSKTLVVGVFQSPDGKKPLSACKAKIGEDILNSLAKAEVFTGEKGKVYFVRSYDKDPSIVFIGLGKTSETDTECLRVTAANLEKKLEAESINEAAICVDSLLHKDVTKKFAVEALLQSFAEGLLLTQYSFDKYKEKPKTKKLKKVTFHTEKKSKKLNESLVTAEVLSDAVFIARDLSNEPSSTIYPQSLGKEAEKLAKKYGVKCRVMQKAELVKEKMGGILGVGQGSNNPPTFIIMEYKPKAMKKTAKKIAFVGKAVTFDTGGISLKPSPKMEEMKHDMSGGANAIAAILGAAKLGVKNHIFAYIPAAENMPGGKAICPSTILKSRSGKTIEVQNTDAEGRLILCDALDYAQEKKPDVIIDMATLTGAVVIALGNACSAIMGNNQTAVNRYLEIAEETGEKHWQLPLYKEYDDDMNSKIADVCNIGGDRGAGSQKAAVFLQRFIKEGQTWMHLDIAASAWNQRHLPYAPYGATGATVRTLIAFASKY